MMADLMNLSRRNIPMDEPGSAFSGRPGRQQRSGITLALLLTLAACRPSATPSATPVSGAMVRAASGLEAGAAWSRPAPEGGTGVVYLELRGAPDGPDRLEGLDFAGAARAEMHRTVRRGDLMSMEPIPEGLDIPAGALVSFAPGGLHVMLLDLAAPLEAGRTFTVTLHLARSGDLALPVPIRSLLP